MSDRRDPRRGLAMLELVLALPMLLFVLALIINFGTVAAWKVREHSVTRLAVWETRWPRTGASDPRPDYWPATASMNSSDQGNVSGMDDTRVDQPVARGPLAPITVNSNLLDPTTGLREGDAELTRNFPLMGKLGSYTIEAQTWLIDNKWQYQQMNSADNWERRVPVLYTLPQAPQSLVNSYVQAVMAIANAPFAAQLRPLQNDPDFLYYQALFGWGGPPDFQPSFPPMCTTSRTVTNRAVKNLIDRIQGGHEGRQVIPGVAEVMAFAFLDLYSRALSAFQGIAQANPPAPPQWTALAQSQIPGLKSKIAALKSFLQTIQANSGG